MNTGLSGLSNDDINNIKKYLCDFHLPLIMKNINTLRINDFFNSLDYPDDLKVLLKKVYIKLNEMGIKIPK